MTIDPVHFYMIRHGETLSNAAKTIAGQKDVALNDAGISQAETAARIVFGLEVCPVRVVHSGLFRARHTADILNRDLGLAMHAVSDLAERHFGEWEGLSYQETFGEWQGGAYLEPPGGETKDRFVQRVIGGMKTALSEKEAPALLVTHGGVFRALFWHFGYDIAGVENCELYEFSPAAAKAAFPWDVFCYKTDQGINLRQPVVLALRTD